MAARIGVGIVGLSAAGRWAATAHLPALRAIPEFDLRALTASTPDSAAAAAARHGVAWHGTDPAALAARRDVDLVVIAVRLPQHRTLVATALQAGKMVYCEWPLGTDLAQARELAELAARAGRPCFIGLQGRAAPPIRYLRDLVAAGYVGEVLSTTLVGSLGQPWDGTLPATSRYLLDARNGATMLTIPLAHSLDAVMTVLGPLAEASAHIVTRRGTARVIETGEEVAMTAPDQVAIAGSLANGAVAAIHYRAAGMRCTGFRWEINGTEGDLLITGENGHLQYGRVEISGAQYCGAQNRGAQNIGAQGCDTPLSSLPVPDSYRLVDLPPHDLSSSVAHAYKDVLDDIRHGTTRAPGFADAVRLHALVADLAAAATSGCRVVLHGQSKA